MANAKELFGRRLKAIRKSKGFTQEQLAHAVRVDYKHLGAIERGVKAPSFDVVDRIAKSLKVETYQLFLPSDTKTIDTDAEIRIASQQIDKARRVSIQKFLTEILRVIKKLNI